MIDDNRRLPSVPSWWGTFVTSLPVLSLVGFFCFLMFLSSLFTEWGLSPLQLISPADIIVPSVMIGLVFTLILYLPFIIAIPLGWARGARRWRRLTIGMWFVAGLGGLLWFIGPLGLVWRLIIVYFAAAAALRLLIDGRKTIDRPLWKSLAFYALALPLAFWVVTGANAFFGQIAKVGLVRDMVVAEKDGFPCDGDLLWLGERAIVVRCVARAEIRVMTPEGGLPMSLRRARPDNHQPLS